MTRESKLDQYFMPPVDRVDITGHAIERFSEREGCGFVEAAENLRARMERSTRITEHPDLSLVPDKTKKTDDILFYEDPEGDFVYVIRRAVNSRGRDKFILKTALRTNGGRDENQEIN